MNVELHTTSFATSQKLFKILGDRDTVFCWFECKDNGKKKRQVLRTEHTDKRDKYLFPAYLMTEMWAYLPQQLHGPGHEKAYHLASGVGVLSGKTAVMYKVPSDYLTPMGPVLLESFGYNVAENCGKLLLQVSAKKLFSFTRNP